MLYTTNSFRRVVCINIILNLSFSEDGPLPEGNERFRKSKHKHYTRVTVMVETAVRESKDWRLRNNTWKVVDLSRRD